MNKLIYFLALSVLVIGNYSIMAQDFEVSPVLINSSTEPGESMTKLVKVTNHNNVKTAFMLSLCDFSIDDKGNKQYAKGSLSTFSALNIITVSPNLLELNPEETGDVSVTIAPPPGDYASSWAAIIVQPVKEQTAFSADKNITTSLRVGGRIIIEIYHSPASKKGSKAKLSNFVEITKKGDQNRTYEISVENLEKTFIRGKLYMIAANMETAEEKDLESISVNLLPEAKRKYEMQLPTDLEPGQYALSAVFDYGNSDSLEGMQIMIEIK